MNNLSISLLAKEQTFEHYSEQFKALSDPKRLHMMHEMCKHEEVCVCDLMEMMQMPQSKLSYHLKILLEARLIQQQKKGTWNYYRLDVERVNHLLSPQLCCLFRPAP